MTIAAEQLCTRRMLRKGTLSYGGIWNMGYVVPLNVTWEFNRLIRSLRHLFICNSKICVINLENEKNKNI